jgi:hypothetical protein
LRIFGRRPKRQPKRQPRRKRNTARATAAAAAAMTRRSGARRHCRQPSTLPSSGGGGTGTATSPAKVMLEGSAAVTGTVTAAERGTGTGRGAGIEGAVAMTTVASARAGGRAANQRAEAMHARGVEMRRPRASVPVRCRRRSAVAAMGGTGTANAGGRWSRACFPSRRLKASLGTNANNSLVGSQNLLEIKCENFTI